MNLNQLIKQSKVVRRYMQLENLNEDELHELYFESFYSYLEMFKERLSFAQRLNQIIFTYSSIEAFKTMTPKELTDRMLYNKTMQEWFVNRFWRAIDEQVVTRAVDKNELVNSLTFIAAIPKTNLMEEIINEPKNRGGREPENRKAKAGRETTAIAQ